MFYFTLFFYIYVSFDPALFERMKGSWHQFLFFSFIAIRYWLLLSEQTSSCLLSKCCLRTYYWQLSFPGPKHDKKYLETLLVLTQLNLSLLDFLIIKCNVFLNITLIVLECVNWLTIKIISTLFLFRITRLWTRTSLEFLLFQKMCEKDSNLATCAL